MVSVLGLNSGSLHEMVVVVGLVVLGSMGCWFEDERMGCCLKEEGIGIDNGYQLEVVVLSPNGLIPNGELLFILIYIFGVFSFCLTFVK